MPGIEDFQLPTDPDEDFLTGYNAENESLLYKSGEPMKVGDAVVDARDHHNGEILEVTGDLKYGTHVFVSNLDEQGRPKVPRIYSAVTAKRFLAKAS